MEKTSFADVKSVLSGQSDNVRNKPEFEFIDLPQDEEINKLFRKEMNRKMAYNIEALRIQLAEAWECDESEVAIAGDYVFQNGEKVGELKWDMTHNDEKNAFTMTHTFVPITS